MVLSGDPDAGDSLAAFGEFRTKAIQDPEWQAYEERMEKLAPERHSRLLEPLGPVAPDAWHEAAAQSRQSPLGAYSRAVLGTAPGKMSEAVELIGETASFLPVIIALRTITGGRQGEVTDIWKGDIRQEGYMPPCKPPLELMSKEEYYEMMHPVRPIFPRERVAPVYPLPYSPLQ